jgi:hypothetical protein
MANCHAIGRDADGHTMPVEVFGVSVFVNPGDIGYTAGGLLYNEPTNTHHTTTSNGTIVLGLGGRNTVYLNGGTATARRLIEYLTTVVESIEAQAEAGWSEE